MENYENIYENIFIIKRGGIILLLHCYFIITYYKKDEPPVTNQQANIAHTNAPVYTLPVLL